MELILFNWREQKYTMIEAELENARKRTNSDPSTFYICFMNIIPQQTEKEITEIYKENNLKEDSMWIKKLCFSEDNADTYYDARYLLHYLIDYNNKHDKFYVSMPYMI